MQLLENCQRPLFFCFTETWLTSNDHDDFHNPKNDQYVCSRFDRAKGHFKKGRRCNAAYTKNLSSKIEEGSK